MVAESTAIKFLILYLRNVYYYTIDTIITVSTGEFYVSFQNRPSCMYQALCVDFSPFWKFDTGLFKMNIPLFAFEFILSHNNKRNTLQSIYQLQVVTSLWNYWK